MLTMWDGLSRLSRQAGKPCPTNQSNRNCVTPVVITSARCIPVLETAPVAAAGLTDHTWSVEEPLRLRLLHPAHSTPERSATQTR